MPHHYSEEEKQALEDIQLGSSAPIILDPEIERLAKDLSNIHGTVRITKESSGIHFYLACPTCLETYGSDELFKMHLALNVEKYVASGNPFVGMCMKESDKFSILDLLAMPRLDERGYEHKPAVVHKKEVDEKYLEPDARGNMVPKSPGTVVPVYSLPPEHQARQYLESRRFDVESLTEQFGITYCEQERDDMFYRKLSKGFRATPQGRIVFYIIQDGVVRGWQARILEMERDGYIWYWHPYKKQWTAVLQVMPEGKPKPLAGYEDWDPAKYVLAHGCARNECLMGYDAAVEYRKHTGENWCGLVEGPLDAGRCGAPVMSTMGKFFSATQALLVQKAGFSRVVYIADADAAGEQGKKYIHKQFSALQMEDRLTIINPPPEHKDIGEMQDRKTAREYIMTNL